MATTKKTDTRKVHLASPQTGKVTLCGKESGKLSVTTEQKKKTCKTCTTLYEKDPKAYSAAKRKATLAAKKQMSRKD